MIGRWMIFGRWVFGRRFTLLLSRLGVQLSYRLVDIPTFILGRWVFGRWMILGRWMIFGRWVFGRR